MTEIARFAANWSCKGIHAVTSASCGLTVVRGHVLPQPLLAIVPVVRFLLGPLHGLHRHRTVVIALVGRLKWMVVAASPGHAGIKSPGSRVGRLSRPPADSTSPCRRVPRTANRPG